MIHTSPLKSSPALDKTWEHLRGGGLRTDNYTINFYSDRLKQRWRSRRYGENGDTECGVMAWCGGRWSCVPRTAVGAAASLSPPAGSAASAVVCTTRNNGWSDSGRCSARWVMGLICGWWNRTRLRNSYTVFGYPWILGWSSREVRTNPLSLCVYMIT